MSTFDGFVKEFPKIRIDSFRHLPARPSPIVGFVSHVHTDHTVGLEQFAWSRFVYCSPATRELLLDLENTYFRLNLARGIFEEHKCHFKKLASRIRALPLETPTCIELAPSEKIQVTLLDANHCIGSVMFLIEGDDKAILYTGDVRAEPWWVNSIARQPKLIPYTSGLRRLDNLYLDTTFAGVSEIHQHFQSKANGLSELIAKVSQYSPETQFHFNYWTFGYEDVWLALADTLKSPIHICKYRHRLFSALRRVREKGFDCKELSTLCGFAIGNVEKSGDISQPGVLTLDESVRIHSCEKGTRCRIFHEQKVVKIVPIITRYNGLAVPELGAGGGLKDLTRDPELDLKNPKIVKEILRRVEKHVTTDEEIFEAEQLITEALRARRQGVTFYNPLSEKYGAVLDFVRDSINSEEKVSHENKIATEKLPNYITFPYSRHSSHTELRHLVKSLNPRDIHPCTAVPEPFWNESDMGMEVLFGDCCALGPDGSAWDREMKQRRSTRLAIQRDDDRLASKARGRRRKRPNEAPDHDDLQEQRSDVLRRRMQSVHSAGDESPVGPITSHTGSPLSEPSASVDSQADRNDDGSSKLAAIAARQEAYSSALRGDWQTLQSASKTRFVDVEEEL